MSVEKHIFVPADLVAGHPALDFVNTVTAWDASPIDWVADYVGLVAWADRACLVSPTVTARLGAMSSDDPVAAIMALKRAKELRGALYQLFATLAAGVSPPRQALDTVVATWRAAIARTQFRIRDGQLMPILDPGTSGLDLIADTIALSAIALMEKPPAGRLKLCRGPHCGWVFLDSSKGRRRIWCDMKTCGNAAKSRRHYARRRSGQAAAAAASGVQVPHGKAG